MSPASGNPKDGSRCPAATPEATSLTLYSPLVYRWCRRMGVTRSDAADVSQEVFRSVAGHIVGFPSPGSGRLVPRLALHHHPQQIAEPSSPGRAIQESGVRLNV